MNAPHKKRCPRLAPRASKKQKRRASRVSQKLARVKAYDRLVRANCYDCQRICIYARDWYPACPDWTATKAVAIC